MSWRGVFPAMTTPFAADLSVDHAELALHAAWLLEHRAAGLVALGSLGEAATLSFDEKRAVLATCVRAAGARAPVIAGISALSTVEAVTLARDAERLGCGGLMVLPPYVHVGDWRETRAHVSAVISATDLPCMLYNNPAAYRTDFTPPQIEELAAEHPNLTAVKESSGDVRRITAIRALCPRLELLVGLDDAVVEGVAAGARGWVAGLVNALPVESMALFRAATERTADELYRWFLPLLRMDTVPAFVQLIKLVQARVGHGNERVRPPRLPLVDAARREALAIVEEALASRR
jgi:1-pyrroline-4-hydroxy-2-carboxylate deaminase